MHECAFSFSSGFLTLIQKNFVLDRALNSNNFTGSIPPSIGKLSNVYWLDVADNQLTGTLPISTSTTSGLDQLLKAKHLWVVSQFSSSSKAWKIWNSSIFHFGIRGQYWITFILTLWKWQPFQQEPTLWYHSTRTFQLWDGTDTHVSYYI